MNIECIAGEYRVVWETDHPTYCQAMEWLQQTFGPGWGQSARSLEFRKFNRYMFTFKRLYHAQWFVLKWDKID